MLSQARINHKMRPTREHVLALAHHLLNRIPVIHLPAQASILRACAQDRPITKPLRQPAEQFGDTFAARRHACCMGTLMHDRAQNGGEAAAAHLHAGQHLLHLRLLRVNCLKGRPRLPAQSK